VSIVNDTTLESEMSMSSELRLAESEARRIRAIHPQDRLVRALVALDLGIRRAAVRIVAIAAFAPSGAGNSQRVRRAACRS